MNIKKIFFALMLCSLFCVSNLKASCCDCWYGIVGAGYAFSEDTGINNPDTSFWDAANEGYDTDLGESSFSYIGIGKQFCQWMNFDATYSYYQTFHYQKYQTGTGAARTRFFDLDHQNALFTFSIDPRWDCLSYTLCNVSLRPIVGVGIGVGIHHVDNFHTVVYNSTGKGGSTTSIGDRVTTTSFAYKLLAALRFDFACSPLFLDIGYSYYDGGRFEGPSTIVLNDVTFTGSSDSGSPWKGDLKTNQVYVNLGFCF